MIRPRIRKPTMLPLLMLLLLAASLCRAQGPVVTEPPAAALEWRDPRLTVAEEEVRRLEAEASGRAQLDFSFTLDPVLRFRDYPGDAAGGEWTGRLGLNSTIDFSDPPDTRARALQTLEQARREVALLELDGITDALLAHAYLLVAQERERDAREDLEEADEEAGSGRRDARLEHRMAELERRQALQEVTEARVEAHSFGLAGKARYEPLRFALPGGDTDPRVTHEYRMLLLELQEAEAELAVARRAPLDDLRLRTGYRTRGAEFDVEGGLVNGGPAASIEVDLPGGVNRWEVELSAQLVLGDDRRELAKLEADVMGARSELEEYPGLFRTEFENALARARLAEEALDLAEQESALRGEEARSRLYRAWIAYVRDVAEVLELSGGSWEVRSP